MNSPDKTHATKLIFVVFCFIFFYNLSIFDESKISRKFLFLFTKTPDITFVGIDLMLNTFQC